MFPGEKEVLWGFKESCHMKSGGETVKQNLSVLGICCVPCRCASAGPSHKSLEILPFQGWRALGGEATWPILHPSPGRRNVCDVGFPLQKHWNFVQNKKFPWLFCTITFLLWKRLVSKLHPQNWKRHYDLHSVYYTKVGAGVSCIAILSVAVRGAHEKEEPMGTAGFYSRPLPRAS